MSILKRGANPVSEQDKEDIRSGIGLGSAALLNAASSGNASSTQVVKGDDTRLSDARTPTAHTHTASAVTDFSAAVDARIAAASVNALADVTVTSPTSGQVLKWNGTAWVNDTDGGGGGSTNLSYTASPTGGVVVSDTGTDATIPLSDGTNAGLNSPAQHIKLDGIQAGATANATDEFLIDRANHTGHQPISSVTGLQTALDGKLSSADASVTNAREWTAATIDQAEAEAGTATTRRAFTAQRVAQAIAAQVAAWWAALTVGPSKITMSTARLLGRTTAGSGGAEEISIGSGLSLSAGTLSATVGALPAGITSPGDGALDFAAGSLTASRPSVNVAQTWNNSGVTFAGWRVNITDTASAAASLLADFQLGGASIVNVTKLGIGTGLNRSLTIQSGGGSTSGDISIVAGNGFAASSVRANFLSVAGADGVRRVGLICNVGGVELCANGPVSWSANPNGPADTSKDTFLFRDGASNTVGQRNGTNAQEFRTYGTFTDASNYRRLSHGMSTAGVAHLRPEGAGSGASGNVLHISGLPTSNPGPGILWNDGGTVKVGT